MARSSGRGGGTFCAIKAAAVPMKTPLGFPASSRTTRPPAGSAIVPSMPANSSARLLPQPAEPSARSSQIGRSGMIASRSAAVGNRPHLPARLVPSAPDDPRAPLIGLSKGGDPAQRGIKIARLRQVEGQFGKAQIHQFDIGVDHSGQDHLALAVHGEINSLGPVFPAFEDMGDNALFVEHELGEALDLVIFIERDGIDIIDQRIGRRRRRQPPSQCVQRACGNPAISKARVIRCPLPWAGG